VLREAAAVADTAVAAVVATGAAAGDTVVAAVVATAAAAVVVAGVAKAAARAAAGHVAAAGKACINTGTLGGFLRPPAMSSGEQSSPSLDAVKDRNREGSCASRDELGRAKPPSLDAVYASARSPSWSARMTRRPSVWIRPLRLNCESVSETVSRVEPIRFAIS